LPEPMKPVRTMRRGAAELEEVSTDLVYRRETGCGKGNELAGLAALRAC
jgi:hypothetical protein